MAEVDFVSLGQVIDSSWGRSSTPNAATMSVKFTIVNDNTLKASYVAVVNFASEHEMVTMKRRYSEESKRVVDEHVKLIKAEYKKLANKSLTLKEEDSSDSIEIIGFNVHNPKRTAYFRKAVIYSMT